MTKQEFAELLQDACNGDDDELFQICFEHQKFNLMLKAAIQVLSQYPDAASAYHTVLRQQLQQTNTQDKTRSLLQDAVNESEFGLPEIY